MTAPAPPTAPFGPVLTAMVTPFTAAGALDPGGAERLAAHLVDHGGNDGVVVSGTTGEAATTTDAEKDTLVRAVVAAVGGRASVVAGVGTNDTAHSVELARAAAAAGADALLAVTPYYSRPPQEGLVAHFTAIADATDLPVMLYDIPVRTGTAISTDTLVRLAEHPRIVALKDAKGDLTAASWVQARCDLAVYSGDDALTLPLLSVGAVGVVGVPTHVLGVQTGEMIRAFRSGDVGRARELHLRLLPAIVGFFRAQGVVLTKAALNALGLPAGPVRLPLVDATTEQLEQLRADVKAVGVDL